MLGEVASARKPTKKIKRPAKPHEKPIMMLLATATCPGAYSCAVTMPTGTLELTAAPTRKVSG